MSLDALSRLMRVASLVALIGALVAAVTVPAASQEPSSDELTISLIDAETRSPLPFACYEVTDALGAAWATCDDDGDGIAALAGLPPGFARVVQTVPPAGYDGLAAGEIEILA
ncbi:MAG: hypothetical protein C4346_10740, partial [Chloroflexota bacterium]